MSPVGHVRLRARHRFFTVCDCSKRAVEVLWFNPLVQSWVEIMRLAREPEPAAAQQEALF